MQVSFEARRTPAETGTVTSTAASPITGRQIFIDGAATFMSNNVARGSLVINFTDQSIADVVSVDSETQLTTKTLVNGIGNTYDVADVYQVFNIIQCSLIGGNHTAVDDLDAEISPILPTAFTQVLLTLSSSATQVETGVSGLTPTESAALVSIEAKTEEVWSLLGLEVGDKVTITPTGIATESGDIDINFTGDGVTSTVMDRQP